MHALSRGLAVTLLAVTAAQAQIPPVRPPPVQPPLAQSGSAAEKLDQIDGFQRAYAASFFIFDACADGLAGRTFRAALNERFAQCPFSDAARARYGAWSAAQRSRSSDRIAQMIEDNGGLPIKVEGMSQTCHERNGSAEYIDFRAGLMKYAARQAAAGDVVSEPCVP